jgi:hypothetical protein
MPGVDPKRRLRETYCPECGRAVGIVTPPRVHKDERMELRRSRHFSPARAWCVGSGGVVPTAEIVSKIGASR